MISKDFEDIKANMAVEHMAASKAGRVGTPLYLSPEVIR
jgi:hypothetical protein